MKAVFVTKGSLGCCPSSFMNFYIAPGRAIAPRLFSPAKFIERKCSACEKRRRGRGGRGRKEEDKHEEGIFLGTWQIATGRGPRKTKDWANPSSKCPCIICGIRASGNGSLWFSGSVFLVLRESGARVIVCQAPDEIIAPGPATPSCIPRAEEIPRRYFTIIAIKGHFADEE